MTDLHPVFKELLEVAHPVDVTTEPRASSTLYRIKGQLKDVFGTMTQIFCQFPPSGYGTYVTRIDYEGPDYVATMWRANSCD